MKIIHLVLGKANPERMNGINRIVHELACAMQDAALDVEVWGITDDPQSPTPARSYPLRLYKPGSSRWKLTLELQRDLAALEVGDRVHLHGALLPEFGLATRILRQVQVPYVITPHGAYAKAALRRKSIPKRLYISLVDERVVRSALAIQVNSESEASEFEELFPGLSPLVIPNGQRLEDNQQRPVSKELEFCFCGRLDAKHKGLDLLLKGFEQYLSLGGTGRLTLIGDGPDNDLLRASAAPLGGSVRFLGALYGQEKLSELASASAFVHTSRHEGMPMAVLEAAALGLPLILSAETNLAEPVQTWNAGLVIAPNTPKTIAETFLKAETLWSAKTLTSLGLNAVEMIRADFSWQHIAKRIAIEAYSLAPQLNEAA